MKIVINGAGIAGLSTYLFLRKHLVDPDPGEHTVIIYEAYDIHKLSMKSKPIIDPAKHEEPVFTPAAIGNAIGLGKTGLSVLRRIDADGELLNTLYRRGHPIKKWKMSTARGWDLIDVNMAAMKEQGKMYESLMIARQDAWEVLRDAVLKIDEAAVAKKKVTDISIASKIGDKTIIRFADGTPDEADLVVGADGLRSVVRRAMFKDSKDEETPGWMAWLLGQKSRKKDYLTPHYEGLTGLGGFLPSSVLKNKGHEAGSMNIVFGPNGFFGHGYINSAGDFDPKAIKDDKQVQSGDVASWWGTFSAPTPMPFPLKDDMRDASSTGFDRDAALKDLLKRFRFWANPGIQGILDYVEEHGVEHMYPTYTTPELPTWQSNGSAVLVGDAAHAVQPSSGQGACQALEDAESLALLLKHCLSSSKDPADQSKAQAKALEKYVQLRLPRLHMIYVQSQKMSNMKADMNFAQEMLMYFVLWMITKVSLGDKYNEALMNYDLPEEVRKIVSE